MTETHPEDETTNRGGETGISALAIESLPERPLRPSETAGFRDAEAIEAAIQMEHAAPEEVDHILLLVRGHVWGLKYVGDGWEATNLGQSSDPEHFAAAVAAQLERDGFTVTPAEDDW